MARPQSEAAVRAVLDRHATLYEGAAAAAGARPVAGRGTAYHLRVEQEDWLVRHYRRGGAVASMLGDRYWRIGASRAERELEVSTAARARGIDTPEVVAAVTYPAGWFVRCDIAVVFIANARDLAAVLFGPEPASDEDVALAATLIRTFIARGLVHADLNVKNILLAPGKGYIVDLDRCRVVDRVTTAQAQAMRARLLRSLERWQRRTGATVRESQRRVLEAAFDV